MSYIVPDGRIQLFKNIPLAPDNENTLYFASTVAKDAYFDGLQQNNNYSLGSFDNATYSREERGFVRINTQVGSVYNACYMRFKNTSFENKWFYAFVTSVEYIANKTIQINYSIDYMVTYMGDFTLDQCFIERETVADDRIGVNVLDEGLSIGPYVDEGIFSFHDAQRGAKVVVAVANPSEMGSGDPIDNEIYNPAVLKGFDTAAAANTYILQLVNAALGDNILGVFMIPAEYYTAVTSATHAGTARHNVAKPYSTVNGYTPNNKKLFVYPYKRLLIDNNEGATQEYRYEYFGNDGGLPDANANCDFIESFSICGSCESMLSPSNYMMGSLQAANQSARIGKQAFPECAWAIDSYKAYRAQINSNLPLQQRMGMYNGAFQGAMSGIANGGDIPVISNLISAAGGAALGAATGYLSPVMDALAVNSMEVERGTSVKGSMSPNTLFSLWERKTFSGQKQCVDRAHAVALDQYFTMYGYKVNKVATPNMAIRSYFTYIKTIGCTVNGEMPADYMRAIEARFDAGVRFWKNVSDFGNYSLDNRAPTR